MSAFLQSGRSDTPKSTKTEVRFWPGADIVVSALDHCLSGAELKQYRRSLSSGRVANLLLVISLPVVDFYHGSNGIGRVEV